MSVALIVLLVGLLIAGISAAIGVAAATVSQHELTRWVAYKLRGSAATVGMLQNPGRTLATSNTLTTLGVLLAAGAIPALLAATTPTFLGIFTVAVGVPLFIVAAYLVPRVLGRRWAESLVSGAAPWLERVGAALSPFIPRRDASTRTTLAALLSGGGADNEALAGTDEMAVVSGVLAFADRPVSELMAPRTAIVAFPEGMLAAEAAHVLQQSGYSRYPVYRGSLDEVVGVAHTLDLLGRQPDDPVLARPPLSVPGSMRAADLMLEMQRGGMHLAVVLDEFGGTAGLVTFEDLLRDLVSELFDPTHIPALPTPTKVVEVEGGSPVASLGDLLGLSADEWTGGGRPQTVGGLLIQALGRIPRAGERFSYHGLEFDILAATATRVERIAVRPAPVRTIALGGAAATPTGGSAPGSSGGGGGGTPA